MDPIYTDADAIRSTLKVTEELLSNEDADDLAVRAEDLVDVAAEYRSQHQSFPCKRLALLVQSTTP